MAQRLPDTLGGYRDLFTGPERLATTVMVELHDGTVIGDFMLRRHDAWAQTDVTDQVSGQQVELGWVLDPAHTGHGYATEAVRELLRHSLENSASIGMSPLALLGLRYPVRLRLLLLFETLWKLVWLELGRPPERRRRHTRPGHDRRSRRLLLGSGPHRRHSPAVRVVPVRPGARRPWR